MDSNQEVAKKLGKYFRPDDAGYITYAAISHDSKKLAVSVRNTSFSTIKIMDIGSLTITNEIAPAFEKVNHDHIAKLVFDSKDQNIFAIKQQGETPSKMKSFSLRQMVVSSYYPELSPVVNTNPQMPEQIFMQMHAFGSSVSCDLSPDQRYVVVGTSKGLLHFYNRKTRRMFFTLGMDGLPVNGVKYSPCGKFLCVSVMKALIVLDLTTKTVHQRHDELHKGSITSIQFSPSGKYICTTGTEGGTRIIDFLANRITKVFSLLDNFGCYTSCFSDDSALLAIGTSNGTVKLILMDKMTICATFPKFVDRKFY